MVDYFLLARPTRIDGECGDHFLQADLNEAVRRRTLRVR